VVGAATTEIGHRAATAISGMRMALDLLAPLMLLLLPMLVLLLVLHLVVGLRCVRCRRRERERGRRGRLGSGSRVRHAHGQSDFRQ
jgi:hypothetical protein